MPFIVFAVVSGKLDGPQMHNALPIDGQEQRGYRELASKVGGHGRQNQVGLTVIPQLEDSGRRQAIGWVRMHPDEILSVWFADRHRSDEPRDPGAVGETLVETQAGRVEWVGWQVLRHDRSSTTRQLWLHVGHSF